MFLGDVDGLPHVNMMHFRLHEGLDWVVVQIAGS